MHTIDHTNTRAIGHRLADAVTRNDRQSAVRVCKIGRLGSARTWTK